MLFNCYLWISVQLQFHAELWKFLWVFFVLVCFWFICTKSDNAQIGQSKELYFRLCLSWASTLGLFATLHQMKCWARGHFDYLIYFTHVVVCWYVCLFASCFTIKVETMLPRMVESPLTALTGGRRLVGWFSKLTPHGSKAGASSSRWDLKRRTSTPWHQLGTASRL